MMNKTYLLLISISLLINLVSAARCEDGNQELQLIPSSASGVKSRVHPTSDQMRITSSSEVGLSDVVVTISPGEEKYPGIQVKPAVEGLWDLSAYGHVEAKVTNLGQNAITINLQVWNGGDWKKNPFNCEKVLLPPRESKAVSVFFGYSFGGKPGFAVSPKAVTQISLVVEKSDLEQVFRLDSLVVGGLPGAKPANAASANIVPVTALEVADTTGWVPLEHQLLPNPGGALDFSHLLDAPAGKYGPVRVEGPNFAFSDRPGRAVRFYGTNLCYSANFPDESTAEALADQIARTGYNAVRLHHFDNMLQPKGASSSLEFDPEKLDRLDRLFHCLKQRGIYIFIDLLCSREPHEGEIVELRGKVGFDKFKGAVPILESAYQNWRVYSEKLLTHVNPYTGCAWKDDPALVGICLINEGNVYQQFAVTEEIRKLYDERYGRWLVEQGVGDGDRKLHGRFLTEVHARFIRRATGWLRELGVHARITDANFYSWTPLNLIRNELEYVDNHTYWDHPHRLSGWALPFRFANASAISKQAKVPLDIAATRILGKPFVVSEINYCFPNPYRSEGGPLMGAYAAMQDWQGIFRFAYSGWEGNIKQPGPASFFDSVGDPLTMLSERIGILFFLRGDVRSALQVIPFATTAAEADNPKRFSWKTGRFSDAYSYLGLRTRIGSVVLSPKSKLPSEYACAYGQDEIAPELLDNRPLIKGPITKEVKKLGLLQRGRSDLWGEGIVESDTLQILLRTKEGVLEVKTERSECYCLPPGRSAKGTVIAVENGDTFATVFAGAVDAEPLAKSHRILLLHLTDIRNSEMQFRAGSNETILERWGKLPHLVRPGRTQVSLLRPAGESTPAVYALDMAGARLYPIEAKQEGDRISFALETASGGRAVLAYEVAGQ